MPVGCLVNLSRIARLFGIVTVLSYRKQLKLSVIVTRSQAVAGKAQPTHR